jgi:ABC-2 type transport system permease protein
LWSGTARTADAARRTPGGAARSRSAASVLFIAANLAVGFTFSTVAANQLQAMQMAMFFFLPSILLSGFMFPFRGMPSRPQMT